MELLTEVEFQPANFPEVKVHLRRISLAKRLRFLAKNFELMRQLKLGGAQSVPPMSNKVAIAEAEIELSRRILAETLARIEGVPAPQEDLASWMVKEAPNELCVEVLQRAGEEMILGESKAKK
jgi:hypothetical protein